jgi:adenylate kinase family enzyme
VTDDNWFRVESRSEGPQGLLDALMGLLLVHSGERGRRRASSGSRRSAEAPGAQLATFSRLQREFGTLVLVSSASGAFGRRVIVTGMPGSGKSTFSRALSARTGLPLIHLDLHYWKPGWVRPSDDEWQAKQRSLLAGDAWIADGNYHETLDLRLERADTVVVLDTPWWVCSGRAFMRGVRRPNGTVMPEGCDDSTIQRLRDEWRAVWVNWRDRRKEPEQERAIISEYGKHTALRVLSSKRAARVFLAEGGSE